MPNALRPAFPKSLEHLIVDTAECVSQLFIRLSLQTSRKNRNRVFIKIIRNFNLDRCHGAPSIDAFTFSVVIVEEFELRFFEIKLLFVDVLDLFKQTISLCFDSLLNDGRKNTSRTPVRFFLQTIKIMFPENDNQRLQQSPMKRLAVLLLCELTESTRPVFVVDAARLVLLHRPAPSKLLSTVIAVKDLYGSLSHVSAMSEVVK
jgi:hypothetical protein